MFRARFLVRLIISLIFLVSAVGIAAIISIRMHMHSVYGGAVDRIPPSSSPNPVLFAIENVNVLSEDGERMLPNRTVAWDGQKIKSIEENGSAPDGALRINGEGRFLIPGLIDGHVHLRRQPNDLLLYLANGVTYVREFSGSIEILQWRDEIKNGRVGPRISVATPAVFSAPFFEGEFIRLTQPRLKISKPDKAPKIIGLSTSRSYDAIKLYDNISVDAFNAVNVEAREAGVHTVGHLPQFYNLEDLAHTDLRELAHVEEIYKGLRREFLSFAEREEYDRFLAYVDARAPEVVRDLRAQNVSVNTTMYFTGLIRLQVYDLESALRNIPLEYANPAMVEGSPFAPFGWEPGRNKFAKYREEKSDQRVEGERFWKMREDAISLIFKRLVEGGVPMTAGTDATVELVVPGFSIHDELETLVANGMSPTESLKAATAVTADIMGVSTGRISENLDADLLLLGSNPLENISNTRDIVAVVARGTVYKKEDLVSMLETVRAAHERSRKFDLDRYK